MNSQNIKYQKRNTRFWFAGIFSLFLILFSLFGIALAADGSGTNTVSPATAIVSSTGNTHAFTYTAAETMDSGTLDITVPAGWSAPQGAAGVAGYTTASSTGIIADVKNVLDATTNWTATQHMSLSADSGDKPADQSPASTASLSNVITASAAANEQWYFNNGAAQNWGGIDNEVSGLRIGAFLKSSVSTASGDISWQDDNSGSLASPLDTIAVQALPANTWTYTSFELGSLTRNSILSYGFRYTNDIGAMTLKVDSLSTLFDAAGGTNWSSDSNITAAGIFTAGNFKEGIAAVRCTYAAAAGTGSSGDCYRSGSAVVMGPGTTVGFWVRPSVNLNAGDFAWTDDGSNNVASPEDIVNLPALTANTWTYVTLTAANSANKSANSWGLRQLVDKGAMTIDIDALGKIINTADTTAGWTAPTSSVQALAIDASIKQEGAGSLRNTITAAAAPGDKWYETFALAQNWSGYTTAGVWIRSSVATSAGQLRFEYASDGSLTTPIASLNIGALAANTWSYQKLTLIGTRTSVSSYGINYATDIGAASVYLDYVLLGPGMPTFSGSGPWHITIPILSLSNGQTITTAYGSGGGASGVTAPSSTGTNAFTTQTKIISSGTLTNIASHPVITVQNPVPTTTSISPTSKNVGDGAFTLTVNGTNFISGSVVRFNGSDRTTTFVSANQVTASIPASDMAAAGAYNITVFNPTPGGGTSNAQIFTVNPPAPGTPDMTAATDTGSSSTDNITNDATPDFTISCLSGTTVTLYDNLTLIGSGTCVGGTVTITSSALSPGVHASINAKQDGSVASGNLSITIDTTAPTIAEVTPVTTPTTDDTPDYTFSSTEGGTITYGGDCSSGTSTASAGNNTVTFNSLSLGTHSNCTIRVTDTAGNISAILSVSSFTVVSPNNPVPTTTSISPTSKNAGDSTFTLTVNGTNFNSSSIVRFQGSNRTTTFISSTQLTATILASDITTAGAYNITVFNPTPGGGTSNAQVLTVNQLNNPVPVIISISPDSKNVGDAGFTMTVTGTDFMVGSVVKINGSTRTTSYLSATELTVSIPASDMLSAGTFEIVVENPAPGGGDSNEATFTVNNPAPATTSISPIQKNAGDAGFTMTVNGTNFVATSVVNFNGSPRTTTFVSPTQLTAVIPASDLTVNGAYSITVTNPAPGGGTSNGQTFTVGALSLMAIDSISPSAKTTGDGQFTITVTGVNFPAGAVVRFNGSDRVTTFISSGELTAVIPASDLTAAGTFSITVYDPATAGVSNAQQFVVSDPGRHEYTYSRTFFGAGSLKQY